MLNTTATTRHDGGYAIVTYTTRLFGLVIRVEEVLIHG